ncbi:MAG: hypothetical protein EA398_05665 [Deltaproteobacteria bacterium]|nr:MAG: hypothetical protein EA398_05665 [Deltaproteobacteria bacterium]
MMYTGSATASGRGTVFGALLVLLVAAVPVSASDWRPETLQGHLGAGVQVMPDASARVVTEDEARGHSTFGVLLEFPVGLGIGLDWEEDTDTGRRLFGGSGGARSEWERRTMLFRARYAYRLPVASEALELGPYATIAGGPGRTSLALTMDGTTRDQSMLVWDIHAALGAEVRLLLQPLVLGLFADFGWRGRSAQRFDRLAADDDSLPVDAGTLRMSGAHGRIGLLVGVRFGL